MKKIFSIVCALAIVVCANAVQVTSNASNAAKAERVTAQVKKAQPKINVLNTASFKKAKAANSFEKSNFSKKVKVNQPIARRNALTAKVAAKATANTDITIGDFDATTAYPGEYYVMMTDANSTTQFIFDIDTSAADFQLGTTYTYENMIAAYTGISDVEDWYAWTEVTAASYKETKDESGLTHVVASMTDVDGNTYNITYDEKAFVPTGNKIDVVATNLKTSYISYYGEYEYTASNETYPEIAVLVYTDKETGEFTDKVDVDYSYLTLPDDSYITFHSVATPIVVAVDEAGNKSLTGSLYADNGDEYVFNLTYEKPDAKDFNVTVTNATLTNKSVAGFWTIGGKNADKTQDINMYFISKALQGTFTEKDMDAYSTWFDDKSTGSTVSYQNLSAANLVSTIVGDSLVVEGTMTLATNSGEEANVTVHVSAPFAQEWGEWDDYAPFNVNTGKYVFTAAFNTPTTQAAIPVKVRKDNSGYKQFKFEGWGKSVLSANGCDLIVDVAPDNTCAVAEQNTGAYQSSYSEYMMISDLNAYSGTQDYPSTFDPETGVFNLAVAYYISLGYFGYDYETMTMDQPVLERDTVDIVSTAMKVTDNTSTKQSAEFSVSGGMEDFGISAFFVTTQNTPSLDGTFSVANDKLYVYLTYAIKTAGGYIDTQDAELTVASDENGISLKGWIIGTDDKYYRLDWYKQTKFDERDTIRVNAEGISFFADNDETTGAQTGWIYQCTTAPGYQYVLLQGVGAEKYGTFSYADGTLGKNYYNICTTAGEKQQFTEGSMTIGEVGDSIVLDGTFIGEDEKAYVLHIAKFNKTTKDTINVEVESYESTYFSSTGDVYYVMSASGYTFYYDIYVPEGQKDVEAGVEYGYADMYTSYCAVVDDVNGTTAYYEDATFMKTETDTTETITATAVTEDAVFFITYTGEKKIVVPKGDFVVDFPADNVGIDESNLASYGDILIDASDAEGNGISLDLYDSKYADGVITPGVYPINDSCEDGTAYPGVNFYDIFPLPCYAYDINGNYWFIVSGTVTVTTESIVVEGTDEEGFSVKSTIALPQPTGVNEIKANDGKTKKFFDGKKIVIRKGDKNFNVMGVEF
ncbi:MAG: hypothetical protein Q4F34_02340 [Prevotellaceae bacterium]|nr:hypothetical protein [Prevotellaceae bacterium]